MPTKIIEDRDVEFPPKKGVPESLSSLVTLQSKGSIFDIDLILDSLKKDKVVLIEEVKGEDVDQLMYDVAAKFGLTDTLKLQSAFASSLGHRESISRYYMSVNKRNDYHIVPPHSEGSTFADIQLASFYCFENDTDGGETILLNVDESSHVWESLREFVLRGKFEGTPTAGQISKIRAMLRLNLLEDTLQEDDKIINECKVDSKLTVFEVLAKPKKSYSRILEQQRYVFWDSLSAVDHDSLKFMEELLRHNGLFNEPPNYSGLDQIDWDPARRLIHSGINYEQLFKHKITLKLKPGDFIIQNNLSWTHSVANWSPGRGIRKVAAAFA